MNLAILKIDSVLIIIKRKNLKFALKEIKRFNKTDNESREKIQTFPDKNYSSPCNLS